MEHIIDHSARISRTNTQASAGASGPAYQAYQSEKH